MQPDEYEIMRAVEDRYWWYSVLRGLVLRELSARLPPMARVLDAGCGTGGMMEVLGQRWQVQGVDAAAAAIDQCHARRGLSVQQASVCELPFADASFDAVLSLDVLYHQAVDEEAAMREMVRVLRPGGVLVVNLPAFDALRGSHDAAVCGARRYTASKMRQLFSSHGLDLEMMHYWNAWMFVPLLLWRRFSRGQTSDLSMPPAWLNSLLACVGRWDALACRRFRVPFGSSVFAVASKSGNHN